MQAARYVSYGVWDTSTRDILRRVESLEGRAEELRGAEEIHTTINQRLTGLEQSGQSHEVAERSRQDRVWLIIIGLITGIICPLIVTSVITILHLHALK